MTRRSRIHLLALLPLLGLLAGVSRLLLGGGAAPVAEPVDRARPGPPVANVAPVLAGVAPAREREPEGLQHWVELVDPGGDPVVGADVTAVSPSGDLAEARSDDLGMVWLAEAGLHGLHVRAEGHLDFLATLRVEPAAIVRLEPAVDVEVRLVDESGDAVPGIQVALLPPGRWGDGWEDALDSWTSYRATDSTPGRLRELFAPATSPERRRALLDQDESLRLLATELAKIEGETPTPWHLSPGAPRVLATTDASGRARWQGLPERAGYRWGVLSRERVRMEPMFESRDKLGRPHADRLSGPFDPRADEASRLEGVVLGSCQVSGRVVDLLGVEGVEGASIVLRREQVVEMRGRGRVRGWLEEARLRSDADGRFFADALAPGPYMLSARWRPSPHDHVFDSRMFELEEAEHEVLDPLRGRGGPAISGSVGFVDPSGRPVPAEDVLADPTGDPLDLMVGSKPDVGFENDITERLPVRPGELVVLHGAVPGEYHLEARLPMGSAGLRSPWRLREWITYADARIGPEAPFRVDVVVERAAELRVEVALPVAADDVRANGLLVRELDGRVESLSLAARPSPLGVVLEGRASVPSGVWRVLARIEGEGVDGSFYVDHRFEHGGEEESVVRPAARRGCAIAGRLVDAEGAALAGEVVVATPAELESLGRRGAWLAKTRTDDEGVFHFRGLAPDRPYFVDPAARRVDTAGEGSRVELTLRRE